MIVVCLVLHFPGHDFLNVNISKTIRARGKCSGMALIEVDICHRMAPLRMLNSITFTYIYQFQIFQVLILLISKHWQKCKHDYCYQIGSEVFAIEFSHCECCLNLIFKFTNNEMGISKKKVIACENWSVMTFIAVDISHRMESLRKLYSVTLASVFQVTNLKR